MSVSFTPTQSVGGLASGLDTNSIITQLMAVERQPRDKLAQRQTLEQARKDALTQIQTMLGSLRDAASALSDPSTWSTAGTVISSDGTKATGTAAAGATPGTYYVTIGNLASSQQLTAGGGFTTVQGADTLHIKVGGGADVAVAVSDGDDVNALATKINQATGIQVTASVQNGKLVLDSNVTGAASTIAVTSDAAGGQLATQLGLSETRAAQDASFLVNNTSYTSATNAVTTVIPGVTLNLLGQTSSTVTLTVSADTTKATVTSKVQAFVNAYNSLVDYVHGKLTEQPVSNPQTDADRQKGMLRGDTTLDALLSDLRISVSDVVSGAPDGLNQLSQ